MFEALKNVAELGEEVQEWDDDCKAASQLSLPTVTLSILQPPLRTNSLHRRCTAVMVLYQRSTLLYIHYSQGNLSLFNHLPLQHNYFLSFIINFFVTICLLSFSWFNKSSLKMLGLSIIDHSQFLFSPTVSTCLNRFFEARS